MEPLTPEDPRELGDFRLLCRIGAGGFGEVFLGRQESRGSALAAIKLIRQDIADSARLRPRFASEVAAVNRAAGPGIPELMGSNAESRRPWLATRYIPGPSLQQLVEEAGPLPEPAVWALAVGLADTFCRLHAVGLFHRDLKPSNVLITRTRPWVIDFSLVRLVDDPRLTSVSDAMGSFQYAAPEQVEGLGRAQAEADVFALGASLLFAATGHPPRDGRNQLDILMRARTEPPDLSGLPGGALRELIAGCLGTDPEDRPAITAVHGETKARTAGRAQGTVIRFPAPAVAVLDRHRERLRRLAGVRDDFAVYDGPARAPDPVAEPVPDDVPDHVPAPEAVPLRVPESAAAVQAGPVRVRWMWRCFDWLRSAPLAHGELILAVTASGALYALDRASGAERWRLDLGGAARGGLAGSGDAVAVGTADGATHVVRVRPSGPSHSRARFPGPVHAVAFAREEPDRSPLLVVCSKRDLHLFDPATARLRWTAPGVGVAVGTPAVDDSAVYCRTDDGVLGAWRLSDSAPLWRVHVAGAPYAGPVMDAGGDTVYAASADGTVIAVAALTGHTRWSVRLDGTVHQPPVLAGGALFAATVEGGVTALRTSDGAQMWRAPAPAGTGLSALGADRDTVYAADRQGVRALSRATGAEHHRWEVSGVSGLYAAGHGLVVGGLDGVLRSVEWAPPEVPFPAAGPVGTDQKKDGLNPILRRTAPPPPNYHR